MNVLSLLILGTVSAGPRDADSSKPVRVFVLAGQSNMEGQAVVDLDHEEHYNGGRGNLEHVLAREDAARFRVVRGKNGEWTTRDDVWVWYRPPRGPAKIGPLSIGYAVYEGRHHFGPELMFGHVVGDALDDDVLLVKAAWGGKSIHRDFRPPRSGGETGEFYTRILDEVRTAWTDVGRHVPPLADRELVLSGLVWFQGWNDMVDAEATAEYEVNLRHLLLDLGDAWEQPELAIVVAETGNCTKVEFLAAQRAALDCDELQGRSAFVPTAAFLRPANEGPNVGHGHHWFGNAESYLRIGEAMGNAMLPLVTPKR